METLLKVQGVKKYFEIKSEKLRGASAFLKAVDDVSFDVYTSETLGIVGESGCGKSTLGKLIIRLLEKNDGTVTFKDQDVFALDSKGLKTMRKHIQMVFQDPFSSLNPRKRVQQIVGQPMRIHNAGIDDSFTADRNGCSAHIRFRRYAHKRASRHTNHQYTCPDQK